MIYGITKIKTTCYGKNTEKGVNIFDSRRLQKRQILSYAFELGKKRILREEKTGTKAKRSMSMWSSQDTMNPKEGEDGLENNHRNTGKQRCGKY